PAIRTVRLLESPSYAEAQAPRFYASLSPWVLYVIIIRSITHIFLMGSSDLGVVGTCRDILTLQSHGISSNSGQKPAGAFSSPSVSVCYVSFWLRLRIPTWPLGLCHFASWPLSRLQ